MFKLKIAFISCCLSVLAQAQGYFNNTYVQPNINGANTVIEIDSGYLVVGQQPTSIQRKMIFYNLDNQGDTVWVKEYVDGLKIFYPQKILQQGNSYLVFGAIIDSADIDNSDLFLASFDENINLNWMKRYGGQYFDNGRDFRQLSNGDLVLVGTYSIDSTNIEDFYFIKTDSVGNIKWDRKYGTPNRDNAKSIALTADGGYIISGTSWIPPNASTFGNNNFMVLKTDQFGNEEWRKIFGTDEHESGGFVKELHDGTVLFAGGREIPGDINLQAYMAKIDLNGSFNWEKIFLYGTYTNFFQSIIENEDNTLVLSATTFNTQNKPISLIAKYDPSGVLIWKREYEKRSDIDQYIYDLKPTSDGGYIFCGLAFDSTNIQRAWVVKLDCFGCDSLLCYYQDSICEDYVSLPEITNIDQEPTLYPNPNTGAFVLKMDNTTPTGAKIYDLNGRVVWQETISGNVEISTSLPTGMYVIEISALGWRKKMVVE